MRVYEKRRHLFDLRPPFELQVAPPFQTKFQRFLSGSTVHHLLHIVQGLILGHRITFMDIFTNTFIYKYLLWILYSNSPLWHPSIFHIEFVARGCQFQLGCDLICMINFDDVARRGMLRTMRKHHHLTGSLASTKHVLQPPTASSNHHGYPACNM